MPSQFRCAGDIIVDDYQPLPGRFNNVQLKKLAETRNFLQLKEPLTPEHPYFFAQIRSIAPQSKVTLGIAGPDIDLESAPGHWNGTVGYHIDTGMCYSSHRESANTKGEKCSFGDEFGVLVSHFGEKMSTVIFFKNQIPVATRYLFETDHRKFLPTICLENGPIDLGVMWPRSAVQVPILDETNMSHWIKGAGIQYDKQTNTFSYDKKLAENALQSPIPLHKDLIHYEIIVRESVGGESPAVGIASCSPLWPSPTCVLLRDFFRWKADGIDVRCEEGWRVGFGIHYNPAESCKPDFDDKKQQLVLCFVTLDMQIVFFRMMIQPSGGFYPLVILTRGASSVEVDVETNRDLGLADTKELLDRLYEQRLEEALAVMHKDTLDRELRMSMFRMSPDLHVEIEDPGCLVSLAADKRRIHAIQFLQPFTPDMSYFAIEIINMNEDSVIGIGFADLDLDLNKHAGKYPNSTGYLSRDGKLYINNKAPSSDDLGGLQPFEKGDLVEAHLLFEHYRPGQKYIVAVFKRNGIFVGTQYVPVTRPDAILPTLSLSGNGYDMQVRVHWQNRVAETPIFTVTNLRQWCLPDHSEVDVENNIVTVTHIKPVAIKSPLPLDDNFNHFEIRLIDYFDDNKCPAPVVALTSASLLDKPHQEPSNLRADYARFMAKGEAAKAVKVGDRVGWGMIVPELQLIPTERLVICYLTINRNIALTTTMFEPHGGLFPAVMLPNGTKRVQFEFTGIHITRHPLTPSYQAELVQDAVDLYQRERAWVADGKDIEKMAVDPATISRPLPAHLQDGDDALGKGNPTNGLSMFDVVVKAKGFHKVQKAMSERRQSAEGSKACVIL